MFSDGDPAIQAKYIRRLKAIRATLESSEFFLNHEVGSKWMLWVVYILVSCWSPKWCIMGRKSTQNVDFSFPQCLRFVPFPSHNSSLWRSTTYLRPNKKNCCVALFGDKILRLGRSVGNLFFFPFFLTRIHVPRVKVRAPKQNMHSKWWQPDCQSTFLAVKPKTEEFNTILTTKLNDPVLKMASFVTNLQ